MSGSINHHNELLLNIDHAKKVLSRIPDHDVKTRLQSLKIQSFILLAHSAFEEYLEERCFQAANKSVRLLVEEGIITKVTIGLISSKILDDIKEKSRKKILESTSSDIITFATEALTLYRSTYISNNGILNHNQINLLRPIGVDPESTSLSTFNALHSFGSKRGDIAHKFRAIRSEHTASSIITEVNTITSGLIEYEQEIESSLQTRMSHT